MGVMLTVLGAIAYIGYRITTLSSFDSTLNIVLFAIESMCILAVAVEAVLLGVKLPVGKVDDAGEHKRFAAADGEPVGGAAERGQHLVPLFKVQLILPLHPDVARQAARIAAWRGRQRDIERQ